MAFGFNDTQNRYDRLINLVIEELKRILSDLLTDKETHKRLRNTIAHKLHAEKTEYIANKRAEMETKAQENSYGVSKVMLDQITHWQEELAQLIAEEIGIERRQAIAIKDDPARIDEEIKVIGSIIKEIKDKAGEFIGARMGRPEKAKLRKLTGSPNTLFVVGKEGGRLRSVNAAFEEGVVTGVFQVFDWEDFKR